MSLRFEALFSTTMLQFDLMSIVEREKVTESDDYTDQYGRYHLVGIHGKGYTEVPIERMRRVSINYKRGRKPYAY